MRFRAQIKDSRLVSMKASQVNALLKHEFAKLGRWWHRVARPRHFKRGAFQRYGYTPRKRIYTSIKKRRIGHTDPLRLSDETRNASEGHRIVATRKGVTVHYSQLRKLNFRARGSQVNMRKEFETINAREEAQMTTMMARSIDRKLQTAARNNGRLRLRS